MDIFDRFPHRLIGNLRKDVDRAYVYVETNLFHTNNCERIEPASSQIPIYSLNHPDYILPGFMFIEKDNEEPSQIFDRSCGYCSIAKPVVKFINLDSSDFKSEFYMENKLIATGKGSTRKLARKDVTKNAYEYLKPICFTMQVKDEDKDKHLMIINKLKCFDTEPTLFPDPAECDKINSEYLSSSVGYKLLKLMGWQDGAGLGKHSQGCPQPIQITKYPKRRGFGVTDELINGDDIREQFVLREVTKHIKRFMKSTKQKLVFSIEFTKEERQAIHLSCVRYALKTKSSGQGATKTMVISKKQNAQSIFEELINTNDNENDYYKLIIPSTLQHFYN